MTKLSDNNKANKMELNRLSTSIISILVTLAITIGSFAYMTGGYNNEIKNVKENQITLKQDIREDIKGLEEKKADKEIVQLIFNRLNQNQDDNNAQHKTINDKLDRLIENKGK
jgi:hypothetical protein